MRPDTPREPYAGPEDGPAPPFPLRMAGPVVKGFGRGSKELGIPTANIPVSGLSVAGHDDLDSGVYFGFAGLEEGGSSSSDATSTTDTAKGTGTGTGTVYPMVMSLGYNPYYKNEQRSVEVHIMHRFAADFYGAQLKLSILGFIRPEYDYVSKEALIADINTDIDVAARSLQRPAWQRLAGDDWLLRFDGQAEGT